jgi:hypothetical protein
MKTFTPETQVQIQIQEEKLKWEIPAVQASEIRAITNTCDGFDSETPCS